MQVIRIVYDVSIKKRFFNHNRKDKKILNILLRYNTFVLERYLSIIKPTLESEANDIKKNDCGIICTCAVAIKQLACETSAAADLHVHTCSNSSIFTCVNWFNY